MLVVGCKGCEGVSVMVVGHGGMSVLVVGCGEVGCATDLLLGLPVSTYILGLPPRCFKSSSCVREGPSLTLALTCVDCCRGGYSCRGRRGGGCGGGRGGSFKGLPLVSSMAALA